VLLQPFSVPVTVYTVVEDGDAETEAPVVAERPVDGDQVYVVPPVPVSVVEPPLQIVTLDPAPIDGKGLTDT
jgi:hypothetical protein